MTGLILHTSNQLDLLARRLSEVVSVPLDSPFVPEIVVVQSLASRRWLTLKIAQRQGVCANYEFPFLSDFVAAIVQQASLGTPISERISTQLLTWKIDSLLPDCLSRNEFQPVAKYLRDGDPMKRFQLASKLAYLFDQYRIYRAEMIAGWASVKKKRTGEEGWQAMLWRQLGETPGFEQAFERLRCGGFTKSAQTDLPNRVSIFAPTSLPPAYLDLLFQLSRVSEVHLFLLRPSGKYRGEDRTKKQLARLGLRSSDPASGNPLATSWGKVDADLTDLLLETDDRLEIAVEHRSEDLKEFATSTLLSTLKADILNGENRGGSASNDDTRTPSIKVESTDRSLEVHACHSPMREVEVLYDQLLNCFETIPNLEPRDVLVMTPEIEKYAPLIQAVFGYPEKESVRIPYSLSDRHPRAESVPIDTFLTLLDLPGSRYTASQIFALLGSRSLRRRFKFSEEDLSLIRDWIEDTAIRWGIDAENRNRLGLPAFDANTWRHGLRRLMLGYASDGVDNQLFQGVLPHPEVEGDGAEVLGRFMTAVEGLFSLGENLERARPLNDWVEPLAKIVEQFLAPTNDEEARDIFFLRICIDELRTLGEKTPIKSNADFRVVRYYLGERLATMEQHGRFFTGGATFCALKPVRSILARVICLLGINDQAFPRRPQPMQFDLMARWPQTGDPSPRQDDRFVFLETLLSAEEKLLISYVGRSAVHNKEIVPSVVVTELLEYLNQAFVFPEKKSAEQFLLTEHPLQAFSPRYFSAAKGDEHLFSYSAANAEASRIITTAGTPEPLPFLTKPLPAPDERARNLELAELHRFWANPSRYLLQQRLGLTFRDTDDCLEDDEPFQLEPLERYPIKQALLEEELLNTEPSDYTVYQARGILPPGSAGNLELTSMRIEVGRLAEVIREHNAGGPKDKATEVDLALNGFRLGGKIRSLYRGKAVYFRTAKLNPRDHLRAWIEHLILCAQDPRRKQSAILIGKDAVVTISQVEAPVPILETLCEYYWKGLTSPLRFFPASAMVLAQAAANKDKNPEAKARSRWFGNFWGKGKIEGEKDDPYFSRFFNAATALNDEFREIAQLIFGPLFEHAKREELPQ